MSAELNPKICRKDGTFEVSLTGRGYMSDWRMVEEWLESDDNASGEYAHSFGGTISNPTVRVWFTDEKTAIMAKLTWG